MISERQQKILNYLIREYIEKAEPISSGLLKKKSGLNVSPATIRNDLADLEKQGYINQPHTSAGRVPTEKGYKYFVQITFSSNDDGFPDFIVKEMKETKERIDQEMQLAQEMIKSLEEVSSMLTFSKVEEEMLFDALKVIGPSRNNYKKNIDIMNRLLEEFENL